MKVSQRSRTASPRRRRPLSADQVRVAEEQSELRGYEPLGEPALLPLIEAQEAAVAFRERPGVRVILVSQAIAMRAFFVPPPALRYRQACG